MEPISESVYASGTISSKGQYQVFPKTSGILEKIYVSEGDSVSISSILFSISNESSRYNRANAELAAEFSDLKNNQDKLRDLETSIDLAQKKLIQDSLLYDRQKALWSQNIGSKLQLEQSELNYINSKSNYKSIQYKLRDLKKQLRFSDQQSKTNLMLSSSLNDDHFVRSSLDGRIYTILKEVGEMVGPQTPVAVVGSANEFIINLQVDEYDIVKIKKGLIVYITLDSYKGKSFKAMITKINPIMNERTKTFTVEAEFIEKPTVLYPNLTVEANIVITTKEKALTIPRKYLINDSFVIDKSGNKKYVTTGLKDYQKVEILQGISETDELKIPE
ncbi:MAG: efflux RND transporter periplasmic adaptor subunit [Bacteroidia bacterium]|nr:efflux RND transporter periplasmic adaptor subunit [Bacteroidia bacterium]